MTGSGHPVGGHVEARDYGGPGDYVQAAYDGALRSGMHKAALSTVGFFGTGFGKGIMLIALATLAIGVIGGAMAASAGTLSILGAGGVMVQATVGQGMLAGLVEGVGALFSTGGALAMIAGGVAGSIVEGKRYPPEMTVDQAQALADKYKESREHTVTPTVTPTLAVSQEKPPVQTKEVAANESATNEKDCEPCFAAREMQRRNEAASAERKVG